MTKYQIVDDTSNFGDEIEIVDGAIAVRIEPFVGYHGQVQYRVLYLAPVEVAP